MNEVISIRRMTDEDPPAISEAFAAQDWNKPRAQYDKYLTEQTTGAREVLIAEAGAEFAGYLTIVPESDFAPFREKAIPEIMDFNVLIKFRRRGVGTRLMAAAESLIAENHGAAGVRVGLTHDYGAAQRMYFKRGYVPDGLGIAQRGAFLRYGDKITVDDDLCLSLTKKFIKS